MLRLDAGRRTADESLATLIDELSAGSPEFRSWWAGHTVDVHTDGTKRIRHPVVGELTVAYETLALGSTPDVHLAGCLTDPRTPSAHALDLLRDMARPSGYLVQHPAEGGDVAWGDDASDYDARW